MRSDTFEINENYCVGKFVAFCMCKERRNERKRERENIFTIQIFVLMGTHELFATSVK